MDKTMKALDEQEANKLWERLKEKDAFTAEHACRVADMVEKFARGLGWEEQEIQDLKMAALIHDIGKLELPDEIFEKIRTGERLTNEEHEKVRCHTGHTRLVDEYDYIPPAVIEALNYHHERFDGSGYPYGIKGTNIPMGVRMLSICDYYDNVVVQREWKTPELQKPLTGKDAIKLLIDETTRRFDPELVKQFFRIVLEEEK